MNHEIPPLCILLPHLSKYIYTYFYTYIFLFIAECWLDSCPSEFKPVIYRRYVDDSFLLFRKMTTYTTFMILIYSILTQNLLLESNKRTVYHSWMYMLKNRVIHLSPTYIGNLLTGLGMKHHRYKTNLVNFLIDRTYNLSSTYHSFINEVEKLNNIF